MDKTKCKLIVIDGLDGSGKATQSKRLCERLNERGYRARTITFPDYESDSSALVRMYLGGQLGDSPDAVNAYAASSFYAVDRVASFLNGWGRELDDYDYIIADRYTTSNIIHQMSKLESDERMDFVNWLYDYEYNRLGIPAPDKVFFLDVDPAVSQKLIFGRYKGDESKKDIHEKNFAYLLSCRESAMWACENLPWEVIRCSEGDRMKTIEEISDMILDRII